MEDNGISASESLKEFIRHVLDERDKGLTARYDEEKDIFILRYIFEMEDKKYLGRIPLSRIEARNLVEYISSIK